MPGPAISHTDHYPFESQAVARAGGHGLRLAASTGVDGPPEFFRGKPTRLPHAADLLPGVVPVVQSRFYLPPATLSRILTLADPVVTCGDDVVRFEAFPGCCSTNARADLLPPALDGARLGRRTTTVDFNAPMRASPAQVRDGDDFRLAIGADSVALSRGADSVVESKVALPWHWLRGFVEVPTYQGRMVRRHGEPRTGRAVSSPRRGSHDRRSGSARDSTASRAAEPPWHNRGPAWRREGRPPATARYRQDMRASVRLKRSNLGRSIRDYRRDGNLPDLCG